jgi:hypothetical protein
MAANRRCHCTGITSSKSRLKRSKSVAPCGSAGSAGPLDRTPPDPNAQTREFSVLQAERYRDHSVLCRVFDWWSRRSLARCCAASSLRSACFVDFPQAGVHAFHELDISIASQLRIRKQLGHRRADGPARCVTDGKSQQGGESHRADQCAGALGCRL